nr:hypothetical protein [Tanacetum cinerariifolium]
YVGNPRGRDWLLMRGDSPRSYTDGFGIEGQD